MRIPLLFITLSILAVTTLSAGVVNFASLSEDGAGASALTTTYSQGGLTFTSSNSDLFVWQRGVVHHPDGGDAATSLSVYHQYSVLSITASNGSPFSLTSIDVAQYGVNQGQPGTLFDVDFIGHVHGGGTVTETLSILFSGTPTLQTFSFSSGFTNLDNVEFTQGPYVGGGTAIQINNIVTEIGQTPEPSSFGLLALGGFLILPRLRRRP